jgi:hypothetical protein
MKGYKAFDKGLKCREFQYEVGKTYKHDGSIELCREGFHFCKTASDCAKYYNYKNSDFAEVEAIGKTIEGEDKCVTDEIKIVKLISQAEFYALANQGENNTGIKNTGNLNTGNWNTGNWNTGNWNTGNWNTGDRNTGNRNTGNVNTGNRNIGDMNTGDMNTGHMNTGDMNTGDMNTGYWNTGDWNTGDWNSTNRSTGFFCTKVQKVKIFDIETDKTYEELKYLLPRVLWHIPFGSYLLNNELKTYTVKDRQNFYNSLSDKDKELIKNMPFFDAEKFEKCTGIKV